MPVYNVTTNHIAVSGNTSTDMVHKVGCHTHAKPGIGRLQGKVG